MHDKVCAKFKNAHRRLPLIGHYLLLTAHRSPLTTHCSLSPRCRGRAGRLCRRRWPSSLSAIWYGDEHCWLNKTRCTTRPSLRRRRRWHSTGQYPVGKRASVPGTATLVHSSGGDPSRPNHEGVSVGVRSTARGCAPAHNFKR